MLYIGMFIFSISTMKMHEVGNFELIIKTRKSKSSTLFSFG